ncbi:MAG: hypothetical protein GY694_03680 [Gammaproteobacteria bacterium]|nr:hypothetical protein [Gammaproteobacteria bacterium]
MRWELLEAHSCIHTILALRLPQLLHGICSPFIRGFTQPLTTVIGYILVIHPNQEAPVVDVIFAFIFSLSFIAGGLLTLGNKYYGIYFIFTACIFYLIAGIYNPIRIYGVAGLGEIFTQFYFSFIFKVAVSVLLFYTLRRLRVNNEPKNT